MFMWSSYLKIFTGSLKPIWLNFNSSGPGFQPLYFLPVSCYFSKYFVTPICFPTTAKPIPFLHPHMLCVLHQSLLFLPLWLTSLLHFTMLKSPSVIYDPVQVPVSPRSHHRIFPYTLNSVFWILCLVLPLDN